MALTTNGLTNGGATTHYQFQYDDSLQGGLEPARTNAVIGAAEADFNQMTGWFSGIGLDVNFRIAVNVTQNGGGAAWSLSGGNLQKFIVGREILRNPVVLVVSQPTWGVDAGAAAVIRQALTGLNERQRLAVVLNKFEDMNYAEIAEVMGLTTKAVKSLLSRARMNLRVALSSYIYMDGEPVPDTEADED